MAHSRSDPTLVRTLVTRVFLIQSPGINQTLSHPGPDWIIYITPTYDPDNLASQA